MRNITFSCIAIVTILNCSFHSQSSENVVNSKTALNQDSTISIMTEVLSAAIESRISVEALAPSFIYSVEESSGKEVTKCISTGMNIDLAIEQKQENEKYIREFEVDQEIILFRDVTLAESIAEYPFDVTGYIDCYEMSLYSLSEDNRSYLFIESTPMNWVGLMSAKFSFYQLINMNEKLGVQTIAVFRK